MAARSGYTDATGTPELRRRIARHYAETHGVDVDPSRIAVTVGASIGCVLAFLAAFEPDDRVAVCEPGYPCYRQMLTALGMEAVPVPIGAATRYQPTPELLDAVGPLDGLVLASPSNPTGSVLRPDELDALAEWCDRNDVRLIADEIYHGITFDRPAPTAVATDIGAIVVNSFSKYFSMTGWRLGWLVLPDELVRAGRAAGPEPGHLRTDDLAGRRARRVRRDRGARRPRPSLRGQPRRGRGRAARPWGAWTWRPPTARSTRTPTCHTSPTTARSCAAAGSTSSGWPPHRASTSTHHAGRHTVRLSFAGSTADVAEAIERLVGWV